MINRTEVVGMRLSRAELRAVRAAATADDRTVSSWIRKAITEALARPEEQQRKAG